MMGQPNDSEDLRLDPIEDVIEAFGRGDMVVIADDERRENEGDVVCAADLMTPEKVNFMATEGRGLICIAMTEKRLQELGILRLVPGPNTTPYATAFAEPVDAILDTTTGISASDRSITIKMLSDPSSTSSDFMKPGHMFPLVANVDGVLGRRGHTEAAVDLARLSGRGEAGAICEISNEDGSMARLPELVTFARKHGLLISSVEALVAYRRKKETVVERLHSVALPTEHGEFTLHGFRAIGESGEHLALTMNLDETSEVAEPLLVRVHSECLTGDVLGSQRCDCGKQLDFAMQSIAEAGSGAVVYLRQEGRGIGLTAKLQAYSLQDEGMDTVEANHQLGFDADLREYSVAAQILLDLGVDSVRLMTNNPDKVKQLDLYGVAVVERVPVEIKSNAHNERYLATKKDKMGHLFGNDVSK